MLSGCTDLRQLVAEAHVVHMVDLTDPKHEVRVVGALKVGAHVLHERVHSILRGWRHGHVDTNNPAEARHA
eukprot:7387591-Prymnesium_polylepis.2